MARTVVGSAVVVREKYYWPDAQLNIWTIIMLVTAGLILGVNAQFMSIQDRMRQGVPWYALSSLHLPIAKRIIIRTVYVMYSNTNSSFP